MMPNLNTIQIQKICLPWRLGALAVNSEPSTTNEEAND